MIYLSIYLSIYPQISLSHIHTCRKSKETHTHIHTYTHTHTHTHNTFFCFQLFVSFSSSFPNFLVIRRAMTQPLPEPLPSTCSPLCLLRSASFSLSLSPRWLHWLIVCKSLPCNLVVFNALPLSLAPIFRASFSASPIRLSWYVLVSAAFLSFALSSHYILLEYVSNGESCTSATRRFLQRRPFLNDSSCVRGRRHVYLSSVFSSCLWVETESEKYLSYFILFQMWTFLAAWLQTS